MSEADLITTLKKKLRDQMNETADHVSTGACKNMEEYSRCCGVIEGLALAERELLDMVETIEEN
jgi:hypothetical protein|tara:strand:- start:2233 stop:2424 length:192 start_codon:yes stop_codon:yes gene_type:complete